MKDILYNEAMMIDRTSQALDGSPSSLIVLMKTWKNSNMSIRSNGPSRTTDRPYGD